MNGLKERFYNELGRAIGTTTDLTVWAGGYGCDPKCAKHIINELKAEGRAFERNGLLYRR